MESFLYPLVWKTLVPILQLLVCLHLFCPLSLLVTVLWYFLSVNKFEEILFLRFIIFSHLHGSIILYGIGNIHQPKQTIYVIFGCTRKGIMDLLVIFYNFLKKVYLGHICPFYLHKYHWKGGSWYDGTYRCK